jgi:hypothetical protein
LLLPVVVVVVVPARALQLLALRLDPVLTQTVLLWGHQLRRTHQVIAQGQAAAAMLIK